MDTMPASSRNETTLVPFEDIGAGFSIQDRVLVGALSTVAALVTLALILRFMKQPCKHRLDNKDDDKKGYDKFSSRYIVHTQLNCSIDIKFFEFSQFLGVNN